MYEIVGPNGKVHRPPDRKVLLFDYTSSRTQDIPLRLLDSYLGYVLTDDYAGYNALALQPGVVGLVCMADYEALLPWSDSPESHGKREVHLAAGVLHGSLTLFSQQLQTVAQAFFSFHRLE